ncbi:MAG: 3-phosphoshikimate 1-carboxyvinyltransferase [Bacteroidetes bacterium]|nr:3-phosphoshikimate 1-carboxyvinyltransferase [Bacteroidota bacterium]
MIKVSRSQEPLTGRIRLDGSKSISNRILILRALSGSDFPITGLSTSKDTITMQALLKQYAATDFDTPFDAGAAGTTFRFMTAFLSTRPETQILTGSERMKQRPVGPLVDALRELGADIQYLEKEGYPPLKINAFSPKGKHAKLAIQASMSSQYISALLMLGSFLPGGLELELIGEVVSRPYIQMTLGQMAYLGLQSDWSGSVIRVPEQMIQARPFKVEADWSAASYHYGLMAFAESETSELYLDGLSSDSFQGDAVIAKIMEHFGLETTFTDTGLCIRKTARKPGAVFEWDFLECPDLAQTLAVICAGTGVQGRFTGLQTLRIKETDRILALQQELKKVEVIMEAEDASERWFAIRPERKKGKANWEETPSFQTYEDHRMAMAFAPLGMFDEVMIEEPEVVVKSYSAYWDDLKKLGFKVAPVS